MAAIKSAVLQFAIDEHKQLFSSRSISMQLENCKLIRIYKNE